MSFTFNNGPLKRQHITPQGQWWYQKSYLCQLFSTAATSSRTQEFTSRDARKICRIWLTLATLRQWRILRGEQETELEITNRNEGPSETGQTFYCTCFENQQIIQGLAGAACGKSYYTQKTCLPTHPPSI